jgi:pre-rRNA-processing protein IPI1
MSVKMWVTEAAIVLPEQGVASEMGGLAVNNKGLTLKELLQQASHYSAKVSKGVSPF